MKNNTYPTIFNADGSETHILRGTKADPVLWLEIHPDGAASICDSGSCQPLTAEDLADLDSQIAQWKAAVELED